MPMTKWKKFMLPVGFIIITAVLSWLIITGIEWRLGESLPSFFIDAKELLGNASISYTVGILGFLVTVTTLKLSLRKSAVTEAYRKNGYESIFWKILCIDGILLLVLLLNGFLLLSPKAPSFCVSVFWWLLTPSFILFILPTIATVFLSNREN